MNVRELTTAERGRIKQLRENIEIYKASISMAEYEISKIEFRPRKEAMDRMIFEEAEPYAELAI